MRTTTRGTAGGSKPSNASEASFASRLIAWQRRHGRHDLPWQHSADPYRIWLSEIMLQQTQVAAVLPYYQRFLHAFPDLPALAKAPLERVLELWSGMGYYSRARNLHLCAQHVMGKFGGRFPDDVAKLAQLPGIGRSTAAAIAAFAFGVRAPILDGNVKRVLARHAGIEGFPGERKVEVQLWRIAEERLPEERVAEARLRDERAAEARLPDKRVVEERLREERAAEARSPDKRVAEARSPSGRIAGTRLPDEHIAAYTQGLMDLGATVCTRTNPSCMHCPLAADCVALTTGRVGELPTPRPKKPMPQRAVTMLLLVRHEAVLVERRPPVGIWGGLWSLPELPANITAERYCATRLGARVRADEPLPAIEHGFTHFRLTITPQPCTVLSWQARAEEPGLLWLSLMDAAGAALPAPIKKFLLDLPAAPRRSRSSR